MSDLFTDDAHFTWLKCRDCGLAAYVTEAQRAAHSCDWFDLDRSVETFLNRWIPRVLSAENRPTIERELRELIAEAKRQD